MKVKVLLSTMVMSLFAASISFIAPISATASTTNKPAIKSKAPTASVCYKANLARTSLNQSLADADNVLSVATTISSSVGDINSSFAQAVRWSDKSRVLTQSSSSYSKLMAYSSSLSSATSILSYSTGKALKNIVAGKISSSAKFDAEIAFKVFNATYATFPSDSAGIIVTTRNIEGNTNTLIATANKAFSQTSPVNASSYFSIAAMNAANDLASYKLDSLAPDVAGRLMSYTDDNNQNINRDYLTNQWQGFVAELTYIGADAQAISTIVQNLKVSSNAALLKLPRC